MTSPTAGALRVMQEHGGDLAKHLAALWNVADAENRAVLEEEDVYGELFAQYNMAADKQTNPSGMVWWARWYKPRSFDAPAEYEDWFEPADEEHLDELRRSAYHECRQFPRGVKP